jgi:hypothetical protein
VFDISDNHSSFYPLLLLEKVCITILFCRSVNKSAAPDGIAGPPAGKRVGRVSLSFSKEQLQRNIWMMVTHSLYTLNDSNLAWFQETIIPAT